MAEMFWSSFTGRVFATLLLIMSFASAGFAQEDPCAKQESKPGPATPERIKQRAQAIRDLKGLLADADATVRLSALDTMLNACDVAAREVAYEAGFASGDQSLRALAFKHKLLSLSQFIAEVLPPEDPTTDQLALMKCCLRMPIQIDKRNMATGEFSSHATSGAVSGLDLAVTYSDLVLRLRLQDAAVAEGTLSRAGTSIAVRLVLR